MIFEKWELHVLAHLIKYPNIMVVSYSYTLFPPFTSNLYFRHPENGVCECSMCKKCGPYVARSFVKSLVQKGFLQKHKYIKQNLNGGKVKRIRWTLVPGVIKQAEQIPELKELMVQVAVGSV